MQRTCILLEENLLIHYMVTLWALYWLSVKVCCTVLWRDCIVVFRKPTSTHARFCLKDFEMSLNISGKKSPISSWDEHLPILCVFIEKELLFPSEFLCPKLSPLLKFRLSDFASARTPHRYFHPIRSDDMNESDRQTERQVWFSSGWREVCFELIESNYYYHCSRRNPNNSIMMAATT